MSPLTRGPVPWTGIGSQASAASRRHTNRCAPLVVMEAAA